VSFLAPDSFEAEQYRVLRHLVERLRGERGCSCIVAVSSPSAGDGKTTTALNLAGALAQAADARVLLIDADLRRPAVLERIGGQLAANHGLVKAVQHPRLRLQNTTIQYTFLNLTILPAGHLTSSAYEIFKSPRFGALLEDARREYDYIILDTPPLVPIPDCRLIEQWVDGFFVVVAAHKTPRRLVQEALSVVSDEKILGLVFNGDDPPVFGYEQYYGYSPLRATESQNTESLS
jgi:capsular exopolysaccharide synthesis family protein